jgi:beta-galactosidase GanA
MRTCSKETKAKLMHRSAPPLHPGWVLSAYWDALNDRPMSVNREKKLREAMGLNSRPARRFYRPCLSVELGEIMREYGWSPEVILWQWVREYQAQEAPCQS